MDITTMGIDLAKNIFHVYGVNYIEESLYFLKL